jgi:hypothetical protein
LFSTNELTNGIFLWWQDGKRKSKSLGHHKTKTSACKAAKSLRDALETQPKFTSMTVNTLIETYRQEKMPQRYSSRRTYEAWLKNHIAPKPPAPYAWFSKMLPFRKKRLSAH